jgi:multimeric flavodoxin WrbA
MCLPTDGYIFAEPEKLAALAGLMKDFFDRCYYCPVLGRINGMVDQMRKAAREAARKAKADTSD